VGAEVARCGLGGIEPLASMVGELHRMGATVVRVAPSREEALAFQVVDHAHHGGLVHAQDVDQLSLAERPVSKKGEHAEVALTTGELAYYVCAGPASRPLVALVRVAGSRFLVVAAVTDHTRHPPPLGLIPLTCNEIQHLFAALACQSASDHRHRLRWSWWRRRHQARARACHYRRQAAAQGP
jgi:hypothetical protein